MTEPVSNIDTLDTPPAYTPPPPTNESIWFAKLIQAAAKAHEDSYDTVASAAATEEWERTKKLNGNEWRLPPDYAEFYRLTLREACEKVCTEAGQASMIEPVYLLILQAWNDVLDWANHNHHDTWWADKQEADAGYKDLMEQTE